MNRVRPSCSASTPITSPCPVLDDLRHPVLQEDGHVTAPQVRQHSLREVEAGELDGARGRLRREHAPVGGLVLGQLREVVRIRDRVGRVAVVGQDDGIERAELDQPIDRRATPCRRTSRAAVLEPRQPEPRLSRIIERGIGQPRHQLEGILARIREALGAHEGVVGDPEGAAGAPRRASRRIRRLQHDDRGPRVHGGGGRGTRRASGSDDDDVRPMVPLLWHSGRRARPTTAPAARSPLYPPARFSEGIVG